MSKLFSTIVIQMCSYRSVADELQERLESLQRNPDCIIENVIETKTTSSKQSFIILFRYKENAEENAESDIIISATEANRQSNQNALEINKDIIQEIETVITEAISHGKKECRITGELNNKINNETISALSQLGYNVKIFSYPRENESWTDISWK